MSATLNRRREAAPSNPLGDPITRWLLMVAALVILLVVVGGFVRLSRAGLSIVEWDVVTGVFPPIGEEAWQQSFAEYQQTPEFRLINSEMNLGDYQRIFYYEWGHRLIARFAGLFVVIPLVWFMWKRGLGLRESLRYWAIAALFGLQGAIGWIMVSSGLRDRPAVSHFRLTIHLLAALLLLAIVGWMALSRIRSHRDPDDPASPLTRTGRVLSWVLLATVVLQIAYGGLVAGLKAGFMSRTWPLMYDRLIPSNLLTRYEPWWRNLIEPIGSHWVHRWLAFVVAGVGLALIVTALRGRARKRTLRAALLSLAVALTTQVVLGIYVVLLAVPKWLALAHQGVGVIVFCVALVLAHESHSSRHTLSVARPQR